MDFGDVEKAFAESDLVREDRFETGRVITGYLEPPAAVAYWDSSGITIWAAKQSPYFVYRHLAACFKLPLNKVRVIQPFIGGGFGGTKLLFGSFFKNDRQARQVRLFHGRGPHDLPAPPQHDHP